MIKPVMNFIYAAALAGTVLAQRIQIGHPAQRASVAAGSTIGVQVVRPRSLTGEQSVAIAIGLVSCQSESNCPHVQDALGEILYHGVYAPVAYDPVHEPYENFTLTVPSGAKGWFQLGVAHFFLLAAGPSAQLEFANTLLHVHDK